MRGEKAAAASTARSECAANCALAGEEVGHGADGNGWAIARREVQQQTVRADPGLDIRNAVLVRLVSICRLTLTELRSAEGVVISLACHYPTATPQCSVAAKAHCEGHPAGALCWAGASGGRPAGH